MGRGQDKKGDEVDYLSKRNHNSKEHERKILVLDDDFDLASLIKQIL